MRGASTGWVIVLLVLVQAGLACGPAGEDAASPASVALVGGTLVNPNQSPVPDAAGVVRDGWPEVRVEVIDGTSHARFRDKAEEFNRALEEFLARLPAQ